MLTVKIPLDPVSHNRAFPTGANGRRFLSAKGKGFKRAVELITKAAINKHKFTFDESIHYFTIGIDLYMPNLFTLKGIVSKGKVDTSNCIKLLEDSIFSAIGVDDYLVLGFDYIRVFRSKAPWIVVTIQKHLQSEKLTFVEVP